MIDSKKGDTLHAIHALSAGSNAAFKILPATTTKIDYQLCSIFARNGAIHAEISVVLKAVTHCPQFMHELRAATCTWHTGNAWLLH